MATGMGMGIGMEMGQMSSGMGGGSMEDMMKMGMAGMPGGITGMAGMGLGDSVNATDISNISNNMYDPRDRDHGRNLTGTSTMANVKKGNMNIKNNVVNQFSDMSLG